MNDKQVYILGAGGHAKVVISTLQAKGYQVAGIYDDDPALTDTHILNVPVIGAIKNLPQNFSEQAAVGIGDNQTRQNIVQRFPQSEWVTVVHPSATVEPSAELGAGTVVFAGAVIQSHARIGNHVILNTSCSVDHDCIVGDYCHLAPKTCLAGIVTVEEGVFMGISSSAIPQVKIGAWSVLGAGCVAIREVPAGVTAVGVPAKIIKNHQPE